VLSRVSRDLTAAATIEKGEAGAGEQAGVGKQVDAGGKATARCRRAGCWSCMELCLYLFRNEIGVVPLCKKNNAACYILHDPSKISKDRNELLWNEKRTELRLLPAHRP
jgi:hypothetical protein